MMLISNDDQYVTEADVCAACGAVGIGSDANFLTCNQCGECYHAYCIGVKPTAVMLAKGWRCLDCAVCDHCGKKNDEARLLLCDECDVSYHIYCVDPPLQAVPPGNWKCKLCSICRKCGQPLTPNRPTVDDKSSAAGGGRLECLQCLSKNECSLCRQAYKEGETIIQCTNCDCWSHFECNPFNKDKGVEFYEEVSYVCTICCTPSAQSIKQEEDQEDEETQGEANSAFCGVEIKEEFMPEKFNSNDDFEHHYMDSVSLTDAGFSHIKLLSSVVKRKRKMRQPGGSPTPSAGLDGGSQQYFEDGQLTENALCERFRDGMVWEGTEPLPDGYTLFKNEEGVSILRKKRQRNLQKLGIGGFTCRTRTLKKENDEGNFPDAQQSSSSNGDKKKKSAKKKQKNKTSEIYPPYVQEAFFGKSLTECLDSNYNEHDLFGELKEIDNLSEMEAAYVREQCGLNDDQPQTSCSASNGESCAPDSFKFTSGLEYQAAEPDIKLEEPLKAASIGNFPSSSNSSNSNVPRTIILQEKLSVEEENQAFMRDIQNQNHAREASHKIQVHVQPQFQNQHTTAPTQLTTQSEFSPQIAPSTPSNETAGVMHMETDRPALDAALEKANDKTRRERERLEKMARDEALGDMATISSVLYVNIEHPNLKEMFPNWTDRAKQILKRWRALPADKKTPFLKLAKDNRSASKMQRTTVAAGVIEPKHRVNFMPNVHKENEPLVQQQNAEGVAGNSNIFQNALPARTNYQLTNINLGDQQLHYGGMQATTAESTASLTHMATSYDGGTTDDIYNNKRMLLQGGELEPSSYRDEPYKGLTTIADQMDTSTIFNEVQHDDTSEHMPSSMVGAKFDEGFPSVGASDFEKMETDENAGFGDILGGFDGGEDDDIFKTLTSRAGNDFNILDYALENAPSNSQNDLSALNFDGNDCE